MEQLLATGLLCQIYNYLPEEKDIIFWTVICLYSNVNGITHHSTSTILHVPQLWQVSWRHRSGICMVYPTIFLKHLPHWSLAVHAHWKCRRHLGAWSDSNQSHTSIQQLIAMQECGNAQIYIGALHSFEREMVYIIVDSYYTETTAYFA